MHNLGKGFKAVMNVMVVMVVGMRMMRIICLLDFISRVRKYNPAETTSNVKEKTSGKQYNVVGRVARLKRDLSSYPTWMLQSMKHLSSASFVQRLE